VAFNIDEWLYENESKYPSKWTPGHKQPVNQNRRRFNNQRTVIDRAREYISKIDGAVEGQGGSKKTFYVACQLINGFDLSIDQARPLLAEWNQKCQPEWNDRELEHKLEDADKADHDHPRGHLLEGQGNYQRHAARPHRAGPAGPEAAQREGGQENNGDGFVDQQLLDDYPGDGIEYIDDRPEVQVVPSEEHRVNLEAIETVANDPRIFQRGGVLVEDIRCSTELSKIFRNNKGSFEIVPISHAKLRHLISRSVKFYKMAPYKDEDGEIDYKQQFLHVPDFCVNSIHGWGGYPGFKSLDGISEIPILHADGSVFDVPGYDMETRMIYEPSANFLPLGDSLTQEDARSAATRLLDITCDFPWMEIDNDKGMIHKSAWLSSLLTVMFRHLVDGCCPMFLFTANIAGTGKSKLADIIATIATGRTMPRTQYKKNEDELKKSIMSILLATKPFVLFDNVENGGDLGGSTIDALMTSRIYSDRLLGMNKNPELSVNTVFFSTGNQVNLKDDSLRRFIIAKLKSQLDAPEFRPESDFKTKGSLIDYVARNRESFVRDATTIMKAFIAAGRPPGRLVAMGSFEEWSSTIREATYWATGYDPAGSQHHLRKEDKASIERDNLIRGWLVVQEAHGENEKGFTIRHVIDILNGAPDKYELLRTCMMNLGKPGKDGFPPGSIIGKALGKLDSYPINGYHFEKVLDAIVGNRWVVKPNIAVVDDDDRDIDESRETDNEEIPGSPF
jgi:hypothetical protein